LEEDLARRDLTINAMAWPRDALPTLLEPTASNGLTNLIDPYGGWADLQKGVLRHVTAAFTEDPLRVLRVARFAARWPTFELAPDTSALMQHMAQEGELKHLVAERVWQELAKGLQATQPSRMLQVLAACGAWSDLLDPMPHGPVSTAAVDLLAQEEAPLASRFASLWWQARPQQLALFCLRHRVPKTCESVTEVALRGWPFWVSLVKGDVSVLWALLQSSDAWRRPERLAEAARCWMAWSAATGAATATQTNHTRDRLLHALQAAQQTRWEPSTPLPPGPARGAALALAREKAARSAWLGLTA
jgi:tRNA nucleotidyltransferase (CCA-adding enzyme)